MTMPSRRVFVLEDNPSTREWLVTVADIAFPNCVVSTAATLEAALEWLKQQPLESAPVCLVDLGLPDGSGVDFIRALLRALPAARPIVTTLYDDDDHLLSAMAAGAQGYLLKDQTAEELGNRLRKMDGGEVPLAPAMAARIFKLLQPQAAFIAAHAHQAVSLTEREGEVLRLIGRGLTNAEAARILSISPQTVASHIKHIYAKLDIGSRAEAAAEALRRGLA